MEEKKYPTVEEKSFGGMVSEPVAAPVPDTMSADGMTEVHDRIDDLEDDINDEKDKRQSGDTYILNIISGINTTIENIIEAENEFAMKQLRDRQEALQRVVEAKKTQKESYGDAVAENDAMISLLEKDGEN